MIDITNPFTPEQQQEINDAIKRSQELEQFIKKAQRAGIPSEDHLARNRENRDRLVKLKQVYFPGQ